MNTNIRTETSPVYTPSVCELFCGDKKKKCCKKYKKNGKSKCKKCPKIVD